MKVLLSSIGSRGDVQPILALARELQARGHTARMCVAPNFKAWVESFDIECAPIGPDLETFTIASTSARPTPEQMRCLAEQSVREQFRVIEQAAQGCHAIVAATALQIAARSIAETLAIPYTFVAYAPVVFPSADRAPARTIPGRDGSVEVNHRVSWQAEAQRWNARFLSTLNHERVKRALTPVDDIMRHMFTDALWLASDPILGPAPTQPDVRVTQTGAWFMQDARALPEYLQRFLDAGDPPIYFGFGSMRGADQAARVLTDAARAFGRRAVFFQGWGNLAPADAGADCIGIGDVNHAALFERISLAVHHGGAGTTHAIARAGCPQAIVPHSYDQFYWSERVAALGIGSAGPMREQLTLEALLEALQAALQPDVVHRARGLAQRIEQGGTAAAAQRLIDRRGQLSGPEPGGVT